MLAAWPGQRPPPRPRFCEHFMGYEFKTAGLWEIKDQKITRFMFFKVSYASWIQAFKTAFPFSL